LKLICGRFHNQTGIKYINAFLFTKPTARIGLVGLEYLAEESDLVFV